jgi:hypothetical protein
VNRLVRAARSGNPPEGFSGTRRHIVEQRHSSIECRVRFAYSNSARHNKPLIDKRFSA